MQRIAVIGSGGAGKSTLARQMGDILGIEVIHLDKLFWRPGWVDTPREEWQALQEELVRRDSWIIDGNYSSTIDVRLARSDTVIFVDLPRTVCLYRAVKRALSSWGRTRPDMGEGCPEHIDFEFFKWVWDFPVKTRPEVLQRLAALPTEVEVIHLQSTRAVQQFLEGLRRSN